MELQFVRNEDHYIIKKETAFFKLGILEGDILKDITDQKDPAEIQKQYSIDEETFRQLYEQYEKVGLIGALKKEEFNLFFIKYPLINPDRFLGWVTRGFVKHKGMTQFLFWSINAFILYALWFLVQDYGVIAEVAMTHFSGWQLAACYLSGIACIFLHELGHGFVCKYYNGKVEKIGVLLIFFNPAMYCDVSDAYMFNKKRHKIFVAVAGLYVNAVLISILMMLWKYYPNPDLQGYLSWMIYMNVGVIFMNSMPFVKLDGYWVLAHATDIPNLFAKSLRRVGSLFASSLKMEAASPKEDRFLLMYGTTNIIMLSVFLTSGLYGMYYLSTNEMVILPLRIILIATQTVAYIYLAVMLIQFIIKAISEKKNKTMGKSA